MKLYCFALALFLVLHALAGVASLLEDPNTQKFLADGFTPAEIQRNKQRQALGMPPIPPWASKKEKIAKKVLKVEDISQVQMKHLRARRTSTGYIAIREHSITEVLLGYLSNHKLVRKIEEATKYSYTTLGDSDAPIEILIADSKVRMCVTTGLYGQSLGLGLKNFHIPRHTNVSTVSGDVPFHDHHTASYLETNVFSIDPSSGDMEIVWVNPDGSRPPVQIALREERLYYTGDLSSFRGYLSEHSDKVVSVVFKWLHDDP